MKRENFGNAIFGLGILILFFYISGVEEFRYVILFIMIFIIGVLIFKKVKDIINN